MSLAAFVLAPVVVGQARASSPIRIYVFAGQSNMVGHSTLAAEIPAVDPMLEVPSRTVQFWGPTADLPTRWSALAAPTEYLQPQTHQGFGPEISAGARLAARHPGATIGIVKFAWNGTNLVRNWHPRNQTGLYPSLLARVRLARAAMTKETGRPTRIAGFFWMQGENDATSATASKRYKENLQLFIASVRRDMREPRMPFVIGQIQDLERENPALFGYSDVVRSAQSAVARNDPRTYMISTDGLQRSPLSNIHFSSRGTIDLGKRFAASSFPL